MISGSDAQSIGARIRDKRRERGLQQGQLAHPELSDSYISLLEAGKRQASPEVLELLAAKLGCSVLELTHGISPTQVHEIETALVAARLLLEEGKAALARDGYARLLEHPALAGLADQRRAAELGLALAAEAEGDLETAIATLMRMDEHDVDAAVALARCLMRRGDFSRAVQVAEAVVDGPAAPSWNERRVALGAMLLSVYRERGDLLRARSWAEQLQQAAVQAGTVQAQMSACWGQAVVALEAACDEEAVALVERALALCPPMAEAPVRARAVAAHAEVLLVVRPDQAVQCRARLLIMQEELRWFDAPLQQAELAYLLARTELLGGRASEAAEQLDAIAPRAETLPPPLRVGYHLLAGQVMAALNQPEHARRAIDRARQYLDGEPATRSSAQGWSIAAQVLEDLGQQADSVAAWQRALECAGL
ncbi:hypothetical protein GCM10010156_72990 [Planobispora rosea]|uniref:HTH cro/C1-type domain-containing protein n=1 Tax=Planobispora rosea TaxID=35762 RepID=A0A8J3S8S2_PLARO|nr:helix-turn-helix transcriptional regulator [Planobispora rosea]GGT04582.1 hypothetical protein GCM10010156_72990 [Planobispora rosea]GIH88889.1 hypothetical protein Pro02_72970 [Planobispora rosea]